jgi:hypothetical protein
MGQNPRRGQWFEWALLSAIGFGCGAAATGRGADGRPLISARDTRILHEDCPISAGGAINEDVNGDGRPDRTTVNDGGRPSCRSLDFNFDGTVDAWVYLDESGNTRRRESDYDRDGRVDEVSLYRAGVLAEQHRATTLAGKLDTWHYYVSGKVARTERDSNGDDHVDQWWEYPAERAADCPLIHSDVDGDGRPDPGATVDVCRDQYVPASRDEAQAPAEEEGVGEVPTEIDTAPTGTPSDAPDKAADPEAPNAPPGGGND